MQGVWTGGRRTRRRVDYDDGPGGRGVHEVRGGLGRVLVRAAHHLHGVCGSTEARAGVCGREHLDIGNVSTVRGSELDERVGELAGREGREGGRR